MTQIEALARLKSAATSHEFRAAIFDLDGCVSDDEWRFCLVRESLDHDKRWDDYHRASVMDQPLKEGMSLLRRLMTCGISIVFITARPERWRTITQNWLDAETRETNDGKYFLFMRGDGDHGSSVQIKRRIAADIIQVVGNEKVVSAYDDREDVVSMYHNELELNAYILDRNGLRDPLGLRPKLTRSLAPESVQIAAESVQSGDTHPVIDALERAIETLRERDVNYGRADLMYGAVMEAMFPDGFIARTEAEMRMVFMLSHVIGKLCRFAGSGMRHEDSLHDAINYVGFTYAALKDVLAQEADEEQIK